MWQFGQHGLMIPEALSASSLEEAEAIRARRQRKGETNLQQAQHDYVKEKEQEMLERLEAERRARQRGEEGVITVTEFAIGTGDHFLASYTPVYSNETKPLGKFDRLLLQQRGLDPESCTSKGQFDLAYRAVNIRRARKLAEIPDVGRLIAMGVPAQEAWAMSAARAKFVLRAHGMRTHP
jgi:CRISPR/Cas system CSM-associated protein Csm4 (group 5 of RAMP superfamily)